MIGRLRIIALIAGFGPLTLQAAGQDLKLGYINRYIHEHHEALAPILRAHYAASGMPDHQLREAIQEAVMWEAECSLDSINSYGAGYERMLLEAVQDGAGTTEARYAVQDALAAELANGEYGPDEMENRLRGSHARFQRCMTDHLNRGGLPPLPEPAHSRAQAD